MRTLPLLLTFALLWPPAAAEAQTPFRATHGVSVQQFQTWIDGVAKDKYRPVALSAYNDGASPRFAATAIENKEDVAWRVRNQLDAEGFQKAFDELVKEGFRLVQVAGYLDRGQPRMAGLFVKEDGDERGWEAKSDLTSDGFQKAFDEQVKAGRRPLQVAGYASGLGGYRLAGIFVADEKTIWLAHHDMTDAQYQKTVTDRSAEGYRPASLSVYPTPSGARFALVMIKDNAQWKARHGLTGEAYQKLFDEARGEGYRPLNVVGYPTKEGLRYAAVFLKEP